MLRPLVRFSQVIEVLSDPSNNVPPYRVYEQGYNWFTTTYVRIVKKSQVRYSRLFELNIIFHARQPILTEFESEHHEY